MSGNIRKFPWRGVAVVMGKPCDIRMTIEVDIEKAGRQLARRAAKTVRRRASVCYGALHAVITEIQEVIL